MLSRTPAPDQMGLWELLAAPDPAGVQDPAGMEQPSMLAPPEGWAAIEPGPEQVQSTSEHPFEACDECGLDLAQLHHEDCGGCYCDGDPCTGDDEDEG